MERKPSANLDRSNKLTKKSAYSTSKKNWKTLPPFLSSAFLAIGYMISFTDTVFAECDPTYLLATDDKVTNTLKSKVKFKKINWNYLPYLQIDGARLFNAPKSVAAINADLFAPLWQERSNLVFTEMELNDPSGRPFDGSILLGYRHLSSDENKLYGVYSSLDRKRTDLYNYFSQFTVGAELWLNNWFIGGNFYRPIGKNARDIVTSKNSSTLIKHEEAARGVDAEVGYSFTNNITGYIGGYYFSGKDTGTTYGPKASLKYDFSLNNGRILRIFDQVGLEASVSKDRILGVAGYISAKVRIGWIPSNKPTLYGAARHMVDTVRKSGITTLKTESISTNSATSLSTKAKPPTFNKKANTAANEGLINNSISTTIIPTNSTKTQTSPVSNIKPVLTLESTKQAASPTTVTSTPTITEQISDKIDTSPLIPTSEKTQISDTSTSDSIIPAATAKTELSQTPTANTIDPVVITGPTAHVLDNTVTAIQANPVTPVITEQSNDEISQDNQPLPTISVVNSEAEKINAPENSANPATINLPNNGNTTSVSSILNDKVEELSQVTTPTETPASDPVIIPTVLDTAMNNENGNNDHPSESASSESSEKQDSIPNILGSELTTEQTKNLQLAQNSVSELQDNLVNTASTNSADNNVNSVTPETEKQSSTSTAKKDNQADNKGWLDSFLAVLGLV